MTIRIIKTIAKHAIDAELLPVVDIVDAAAEAVEALIRVRASPGFQRDGGDKTERRCNQCVHCGQEMPEGDQVCGYCRRKHGY